MANFPKPSDIEKQYFQILKSVKPSLNVNDQNSDFVIRGKVFAGLISGVYGDQSKVNNDTYIPSARPEALDIRGADLGIVRNQATLAQSPAVTIHGTQDGVTIPVGQLLQYNATGVQYVTTGSGVISGGVVTIGIQATTTGSVGNVLAPDSLTVINPPTKVAPIADIVQNISDGSDAESDDSFRARILSRYQEAPAGGNETDYVNFAFKADPSIRSAFVRRFGRGLGTVDVYITSGTTDIDTAVTTGLPVVRTPSSIVLAKVQAYYDANVPLTDCPGVFGPTEQTVDVTVKLVLAAGLTLASVPTDPVYNPLSLNIGDLVKREVSRVLYRLPIGGRVLPGGTAGYVVASDIEENLDVFLSAITDPNTRAPLGKIPVLLDRQVQPLSTTSMNLLIGQNKVTSPGNITLVLGV